MPGGAVATGDTEIADLVVRAAPGRPRDGATLVSAVGSRRGPGGLERGPRRRGDPQGADERQMPVQLTEAPVLIVADALEPEALGEEALATEAGFRRFLQVQEEFKATCEC